MGGTRNCSLAADRARERPVRAEGHPVGRVVLVVHTQLVLLLVGRDTHVVRGRHLRRGGAHHGPGHCDALQVGVAEATTGQVGWRVGRPVAAANAGLTVVIQDEAGEWQEYEDSTYTITVGTEIVYGIWDSGQTSAGLYVVGTVGPGSIMDPVAVSSAVNVVLSDDAVMAADYGVHNPFISMDLLNSVDGELLYTATFVCTGEGDAVLQAVNENWITEDTQTIHQVPEPATLAIMGIGGLLLRKRRRA